MVLVEGAVDLGADPADDAAIAPGEEQLRIAVLEERVELAVEVRVALQLQRRDPLGPSVQPERQLDELPQIAAPADGGDLDRHGAGSYPTGALRRGDCDRVRDRGQLDHDAPAGSSLVAPEPRELMGVESRGASLDRLRNRVEVCGHLD